MLKLNIQLFGGRGASSSKTNFLNISANTSKEFYKKRKKYVDKNIKFETSNRGNYNTLKAMLDGKIVGDIRYETINNQSNVIYISVEDEYKRSGIATKLYKELQSKTPNKELVITDFTNEGEILIKKIGNFKKAKDGKYYGKIK